MLAKDTSEVAGPNEQLVKCAQAREIVVDEFSTLRGGICNEALRGLTGGNAIAARGNYEREQNFETDFLLRLVFNEWPQFMQPLSEPDLRRLGLLYFPCTFKPAHTFNASDPTHRLQVDFKDRTPEFAAEYVTWARVLARATRAGGAKVMLPEPSSSRQTLDALAPQPTVVSDEEITTWVRENLRPLQPDQRPASREVIDALAGAAWFPELAQRNAKAQHLLRAHLESPSNLWQARIGGVMATKVRAYKYRSGVASGQWCTTR